MALFGGKKQNWKVIGHVFMLIIKCGVCTFVRVHAFAIDILCMCPFNLVHVIAKDITCYWERFLRLFLKFISPQISHR